MKKKLLVMMVMLISILLVGGSCVFAANEYKNNSGNYYSTLADAFNNTASGGTITVMNNVTDSSNATLASGKTLTLELNGRTITKTSNRINVSGTLTIKDGGTMGTIQTTSLDYIFGSNGTINLQSGILYSDINSSSAWSHVINTTGTVNVTGGTIRIRDNATSTSYGARAITGSGGNITVSGGTIEAIGLDVIAIERYAQGSGNGTISISGSANIIAKSSATSHEVRGVAARNGGSVTINISGGTISAQGGSKCYGVESDGNSGAMNITGGTITSSQSAVKGTGTYGTITIGDKNAALSETNPLIQGNTYGAEANITFSNGTIKGKTKAINGTTTIGRSGFNLSTGVIDGYEVSNIGQNYTDGTNYYGTLADAFSNASSGKTITVLNNVSDSSNPTLASGKTLTLDLNGKTITKSSNYIKNNGTLTIKDSGTNGTLQTTTMDYILGGNGTLNIQSGTIYSNVNSDGNWKDVINTGGTVNITGGTVTIRDNVSNSSYGVRAITGSGGTITISGGTVEAIGTDVIAVERYAQGSSTSGTINISGTANIVATSNNTSKTVSGVAIREGGTINVNISGGNIFAHGGSESYAYENQRNAGTVKITGGTLDAGTYGVYISDTSSNAITIGTKDGNVLSFVPSIAGGVNGINVASTATPTVNFYDGVIKGKTKAINGTVSEVETNSSLMIENDGTYEIASLGRNYTDGTTYYATLAEAFSNASSGKTITVLRDTVDSSNVSLASGKSLTLDLNGYTITKTSSYINNNGTLTIKDSDMDGTLQTMTLDYILGGNGTLNIQSGTIYAEVDSTDAWKNVINTGGTVNITGGTIRIEDIVADSTRGVRAITGSGGNIIISGGTVEAIGADVIAVERYAQGSNTTGSINISGTANIIASSNNSGATSSAVAIREGGTINVNISGGNIFAHGGSESYAYENQRNAGTVNITGGTLDADTYGVYISDTSNNTINIGTKDGNVIKNVPSISGNTNGLKVDSTATPTIKYYDGEIKGKTHAISATISETETGYIVSTVNNGTYEIDTLYMPKGKLMAREHSNFIIGYKRMSAADKAIYGNTISKIDNVKNITLLDTNAVPADVLASWDISLNNDGSVMAWLKTNATDNTKWDLYIGGENGIEAPANSNKLFANYTYTDSLTGIEYLDTSNVIDMSNMFYTAGYNSTVFELDVSGFNTSNVTNMSNMFYTAGYNSTVFELDVSGFNTSNVTNMSNIFYYAGYKSTVFTLDVSGFNTSNVTNMSGMFECAGYSNSEFTLNISNFDTSKVTNMASMFECTGYLNPEFTLDVSSLVTDNVRDMSRMFRRTGYNSTKLTLNLSNFNTSNVENMFCMFDGTGYSNPEFTLDVSNFDTSEVTNMSNMFGDIGHSNSNFVLDVSNFDTSKVKCMGFMFNSANIKLLNLKSFDVSALDGVTIGTRSVGSPVDGYNLDRMFQGSSSKIKTIILGPKFTRLDGSNMFMSNTSVEKIISLYNGILDITDNDGNIANNNLNPLDKYKNTTAVIYVPTETLERAYEADSNYAALLSFTQGADSPRIESVLGLVGEPEIIVEVDSTYTEAGVKLFGDDVTADGDYLVNELSTELGLKAKLLSSNVNTAVVGEYQVVYGLYDGETKVAEETRTVKVVKPVYYQVGDNKYTTLAEAYSACGATDTITVIAEEDFTDNSAVTIVSGKNITLDFAESDVTIDRSNVRIAVNEGGELTIKGKGTLQGTSVIVYNKGTFTLKDDAILTSNVTTNIQKREEVICNDGTGNVYITGGTVSNTSENSNTHTIANYGSGTLYVSGGTINGYCGSTIYNNNSNGKTEITGGYIYGNSTVNGSYGVVNASNGEIIITGGTIESDGQNLPTVYANTSGKIKVLGGELITNGFYIVNSNGSYKIEIGSNDETVSTTTPVLRNNYEKYFSLNYESFFDGIIMVKGSENPSIDEDTIIPEGYIIAYGSTTIDGVGYKTAYLKKAITSVTVPEASYTYTGSAITPVVTAKHNDTVLVKDTDYTVTYTNNINIGTATVTVTGIGDYAGTATTTFEITKATGSISYITSDKKLTNLKVGDWVDYQSDNQGETTGWRVWAIEGDKVIIKPVGTPKLSIGATSGTIWNDIPSKIEEECKKFTNASLNITLEDIRSLTLEEIEAVTEIGNKKNNYINDNGKRYGEIVTYTFGGFIAYLNKTTGEYELVNGSNQKVNATESKPLSVINNYYKYNGDDIGWKTIPGSSTITYGDLINGSIWLPTIFANATASGPEYGVYYVRKDVVGGNILAYQNSLYIRENFVAPLVTLDASKIQIANDNTGNGTSKAKAYKISLADTKVEKTYGDSAFTKELTKTGDGAVTYASSNTDVATINATTGEVTIIGAGTATITATVTDSATYTYPVNTASYELTVNKKTPTLTVSNKSVKIDEIIDAMFEYDGDGTTLEVTSGSTSIAEITSSALNTKTIKVKGISLGSTTVTVTITGGTNYEDITETFIVTVNDTNIEITTQPANQTIFKNQNATFSIVAEGSNLTYQWYKAEDGSSSGTAIDGATNRTYTLSNATIAMDGTYYYCKVTNSAGSVASDRAKLTVNKLEGNIAYIASDKLLTNLKVGDWVNYQSDNQGEATGWRVWAIEGNNVIIKPADAVGNLTLGQNGNLQECFKAWRDSESLINEACKAYTNAELGITASNIRSLTIEDIEDKLSNNLKPASFSSKTYTSGQFGAKLQGGKNVILDNLVTATEGSPVEVQSDYWEGTPTWKKISDSTEVTYGDLVGSSWQWLASPCVFTVSDFAYFDVRYVRSGSVNAGRMFHSDGTTVSRSHGLAPLVELDVSQIQISNDNTGNGTSKANAYKISLADTKVEKTYGDSAFTQELIKTGDGTVTYASSNTDVATVNATSGEVTIVGAGNATITATVVDGTNYTYATKTASYTLTVNKLEGNIAYITSDKKLTNLKVGDWVNYQSDSQGETTGWRVWAIEGDKVIIKPADAVGNLTLGQNGNLQECFKAWRDSERLINEACKKYTSAELGITASNIRSMKIEDIEDKLSNNLKPATFSSKTYTSGQFGAKYNGAKNVILTNLETASDTNKITVQSDWWGGVPTWKNIPGSTEVTYGDLVGSSWQWLASPCVVTYSDYANFGVRRVSSGDVNAYRLFYSDGTTVSLRRGLAPLVELDVSQIQISNDNTGNGTSKANAYKISLADTKVEKTYGDSAFTQELIKTGDGTVTYASSNTDVATINATTGEVTIVGAGTATITATVTDSATYTYPVNTASYELTVNKKAPTLTVNPTSINIVAGNKATSNVTYNGDGTLSVSSSATGVATATVANKHVTITGVSAGTATITVSATEGDNYLANTTTINVLVRVANYYDDKGINYTTLDEAFNDAETGSIIKPYRDMEESATATVPAGKTIVLDLDGKKITAPREESCTLIINNGTLELKDSGAGGEIRLDSNYVEDINVSTIPGIEKKMVVNNGTLTVSSGTYTSRADDGKVVVIESNGVTNVTGGVINATNNGNEGYSRAIVTNGGTLNVSAGTISASANSIYNCYAIVNEGISATDINITGGEISGDRGAIYIAKRDATCLDNNTTLSVSGNAVIESSKGYGIYNNFSVNDIEITGGNIHAGIDGIYNEESKVIVGTKDGNVLVSSPIIAGDVRGIASVKGIELYDGKLEGKIKSIEGTVVAKEDGYEVYNSSELNGDGYYETFLKKVSELEVSVEILELIAQGDDGTITYTYEGDGIITATSSDESVATVVVNETDHTITVTPIKAGNVEITIVAPDTDTYIGSEVSVKVSVEPAEFEITLDTEIYTYDGNPCTPEITVVANGEELVEGEDYEIEYVDNVNAGTATVIIRGIGDYEGSTSDVIFRINKAQVNVPTGKELLYTGSMQTGVDEGELYRLLNNTGVDVGEYTATAILKDKINYEWAETESSDNYEVSWKIAGKLMTLDAISIESISDKQYTGSAITPKPTVTDVELHKTLVENTDFTYSYENNVEVGVATVTITGKGIYAGTLDTTFNILPSNYSITKDGVTTYFETLAQAVNSISVDGVTIKLLTNNYTDTSDVVIDKQIVLDTNGKTLIKKDHSIDVDSTGTLKVNGAGTVTASNVDTITNSGKVYIETANTKIENTAASTYCAIRNDGTLNVSNGSVTADNIAIIASGTVNVSGGIVESDGSSAIKVVSSGSVNVSNNAKVIGNGGSAITSESTKANAINITGGRIEATGKAVNNIANTVITLGTKDGNITKNAPVIISTGDVAVYSAGGINFYDGLLLSENSSNVFTGEIIDTEANCTVVKEDCVYEATSYHSAFVKQEGKLDIEAEDIKLYAPGDDGVMTYTYVGNGDISVTSSNNEIATVTVDEENHKIIIHPVKEGEVTITVSSRETDTCTADSKEIAVKVICSEMDVTLSETTYDYNGTERKPDVTVKTGEGKELVEGIDYTVSYENNTNAGTATVKVTGIGDYEGINETTTFTINKIVVTVPTGKELVYNGSIQVGVDAGELYDISGNSAIKIGEYTAIAKLKDTFNYEWNTAKDDNADKQISWKILGKVISIENIEVENVEDQTYTGNEIKPTPVVKDVALDAILVNSLDFKYTYTNNVNAGTATITITGLGNYTGSIAVTFDILPIKVEVPVGKTLTYNGLEQTGVEPNALYTLTNNKKTNAGEYVATARLISQVNYEWVTGGSEEKEIAWKILAKDLRDVTIGNISDYTYNGKAIKPTPAVIDEERGTSLTAGTDFEYSYNDNIDAGTATLTITFKNNYEGEKEFKFVINRKEVEVVWQNTELRYDGTERVPTAIVNSGVTGETINLEVTGSGKSDVGTGYESTARIASVTGGRAEASNYLLTNTKVSYSILADNYFVGGLYYHTLAEAMEAADSTDTIEVMNNVTDESEEIAIPSDKDITIETNGYAVRIPDGKAIEVATGGSLTIAGTGTISGKGESEAIPVINSLGEVKIDGAKVVNTNPSGYAIIVSGNGELDLSSGTINGKVKAKDSSNINVTGGTIMSSSNDKTVTLVDNASLDITSGTISANIGGTAIDTSSTNEVTIGGDARVTGAATGIRVTNGDVIITGGTVISEEGYAIANVSGRVVIGKEDDDVSQSSPVIRGKKAAYVSYENDAEIEVYDGVLQSKSNCIVYVSNDGTVNINNRTPGVYIGEGKEVGVAKGYQLSSMKSLVEGLTYNIAFLRAEQLPRISGPKDVTVMRGEKATFEVEATSGIPNVYTYKWYVSHNNGSTWEEISGEEEASYTIPVVTLDMNANLYRVVVSNGLAEDVTSRPAKLIVKDSKDDNGPVDMVPIGRFTFVNDEKISKYKGNDVAELELVIKTTSELATLTLNNVNIPVNGAGETNVNGNAIVVKNDEIVVRNSKDEIAEYAYTFKVYAKENGNFVAKFTDEKGHSSSVTQTIEVFKNALTVAYSIQEPTIYQKYSVVTFTANRNVKFVEPVEYAESMNKIGSGEYVNKYTFNVYANLPETTFAFEDSSGYVATVTLSINDSGIRYLRFTNDAQDIDSITLEEAFTKAQNMENEIEANEKQGVQSRYGTTARQTDMFLSRARDIGAADILANASVTKAYDQVLPKEIAGSGTYDGYGLVGSRSTYVAGYTSSVENKLTTATRQYVDKLPTSMNLYKGILDTSKIVYDNNMEDTSFRATIIVK